MANSVSLKSTRYLLHLSRKIYRPDGRIEMALIRVVLQLKSQSLVYQNTYFNANCMILGSLEVVIWP
jgi:hypothetical protein